MTFSPRRDGRKKKKKKAAVKAKIKINTTAEKAPTRPRKKKINIFCPSIDDHKEILESIARTQRRDPIGHITLVEQMAAREISSAHNNKHGIFIDTRWLTDSMRFHV